MLDALVGKDLFAAMLIFARLGAVMMLMPGIGEAYVLVRARLLLAVLVTLIFTPILAPLMPTAAQTIPELLLLVGREVFYGLFIGGVCRLLFSALQIAGTFIATFSGLASVNLFNPLSNEQTSLESVFLSLMGVLLVFATDLHHSLIQGIMTSYELFSPQQFPPMGDFSHVLVTMTSQSFLIALQLSAPFLVISVLMNLLMGVMSRLMPQLQIFFLSVPLQILLSFAVMLLAFSSMMLWFFNRYQLFMGQFMAGQNF